MQLKRLHTFIAFASLLSLPAVAEAAIVVNPTPLPQCADNTAFFDPTLAPSIDLPAGFTVSVFVAGLNAPTGIAFLGNSQSFQVFVLESGHGIQQRITATGW
jgi:glucose/arabinose dehydrogenase